MSNVNRTIICLFDIFFICPHSSHKIQNVCQKINKIFLYFRRFQYRVKWKKLSNSGHFFGKKVRYTSVNLIFDKILRDESGSKNGKKCQTGQILWTQKANSIGYNESFDYASKVTIFSFDYASSRTNLV